MPLWFLFRRPLAARAGAHREHDRDAGRGVVLSIVVHEVGFIGGGHEALVVDEEHDDGHRHDAVARGEIDERGQAAWERNAALIQRLARIDSLSRTDAMPRGTVSIPVEGAGFGLPLAGIIDIDAEKARLQKALARLEKELGGLRGRLENPKFAASAPEEVVQETRANLAAREEEEVRIREALARLAELD